MKTKVVYIFIILSLSVFSFSLDKLDDLSFVNTDINQVLKTIAEAFGVTIVPDKDVQGTVTRYFKNTTLDQTLSLLLEPLEYMYEVKDGIYFIRKKPIFTVEYNDATKKLNIISKNGNLKDIIDKISLMSKETIIFNGDTSDTVSINIFDKNIIESLNLLSTSKNYEVKKEDNSYLFKKKEDEFEIFENNKNASRIILKGDENNIEIKLYDQSSNELIISLFKKFDKKLSLLSRKSVRIPYLDINNVTFDNLLNIIFQHTNQAYTKIEDTYYIYDAMSNEGSNIYRISSSYKLMNLDYKTFAINIPSQIIPPTAYKIDTENNIVTVFGSPSEVESYINYIKNIDQNQTHFEYRIFSLKNIDASNIKKYLPDKYQKFNISILEEKNAFVIQLDDYDYETLKKYLEKIDIPVNNKFTYRFKYLKPEDVLKGMLPKYINKDQIVVNNNESALIFTLTEDAKKTLFEYLDSIDVPTPVIRYQLLIVEYSTGDRFNYDWGIGINGKNVTNTATAGTNSDRNGINANFDIATVFGYSFSAYLNYQVDEDKAKIQMSTEIYGLSGETLNLTNTQTEQYKDYATDEVTKEKKPIYVATTFGLNIEIKGRATSSNEVYVEVAARISDGIPRAEEAPPTVTEKSVKNSIRTKTGKPVILGGLTSQKGSTQSNKFPILGQIPIIGELFKSRNNFYRTSEFVIYVIPFIQKSQEDLDKERREFIKKMYEYFVMR